MNVRRTTSSIKNIRAGLLNKVVSLFVPFILRTLIIQKLGAEYLGLNSLFSSILQMLSLAELGFGTAIVYSMYEPIAKEDDYKVCALLNLYKRIYRMIGLFILSVGVILTPFLEFFVAGSYPKEVNIYVVYIIYLVNTAISYLMYGYKSSLLVACLRSDVDSFIIMICNLILYVGQAIVLVLWESYYLYALLIPLLTVIGNIIKSKYVDKSYPQYVARGNLERESINQIKKKVLGLIGHKVGGMVFSSVDNVVISSYLGLFLLGKYSNYYYIYTALNGFMLIITQSITAVLGNSVVCESREYNYSLFKRIFTWNAWLTTWSTVCLLCLYQPFMKIWMGTENLLPDYVPYALVFFYYINNARRILITFKDAAGMWNADILKPYISVLVNLVLNLVSVGYIGLLGVIVSSICALLFVEIPWETKVLFRDYFKRDAREYVKMWFYNILVLATCVFFSLLVCRFWTDGILAIFLKGIACTIVFVVVLILFYRNMDEYQQLQKKVLGKMKRRGV